jgi:hypothetical protein
MKRKAIELDRRGLGAKVAAPGDDTLRMRVRHRRMIGIGVGKGQNGAVRH